MGSEAYVPGFGQDLFLSYAREDGGWVSEFQNKLIEALLERGLEPSVWRDVKDIRFGQNWKEQMFQAIEQTALFLAILSPNYRNSDYCNDESDYFQELREKAQDLRIGTEGLYRYLKVVRMPSDDGWHSGLLPDLQQIEFFTRDLQDTDFLVPFTAPEFTMKIGRVAHALAAALKAMRRTREMVYVASPADDVDVEWRSLRSELRAQGYVVGPAPLGPVNFMHRPSASENPQVPLSHHHLDATHISPGVIAVGVERSGFSLEAGAFHGREPDEN
ncbi:MAG: toll/interleukin-1 receptor domain-containing protein, partial [Bryobacteraceae bacterium]